MKRTVSCVILLAFAVVALAACNDPDPLWGPGTPRNASGEYLTPNGTPIPGGPTGARGKS
jgi:hypothetical protein